MLSISVHVRSVTVAVIVSLQLFLKEKNDKNSHKECRLASLVLYNILDKSRIGSSSISAVNFLSKRPFKEILYCTVFNGMGLPNLRLDLLKSFTQYCGMSMVQNSISVNIM